MEIRTAAPRIPDHEVLRCIGKGSYGEVWLARAVTGTLRAVKVVRREDFELDRTFEREFEGIMKFEPISRDHPGLVHVLHVGRNDEEKFYYYVMELADDRERGSRVDAADYEARTMGTDKAFKNRLPIADCVEAGAQLAEGLAHLHECGLTHRDIKPSNIIFVNGKAKLADIGLVATAGQMTFVGTEGFVPPEGPGTTLADIYSLGMVLYEMSTGKDRLQFPELPDDLGEAKTRPQWHALNDIILKACSNQPKKRFPTSREMALALRAAGRKKLVKSNFARRLITFSLVTAAIAFTLVTWRHRGVMPWPPGRFADVKTGIAPPTPDDVGKARLESNPSGAAVYFEGKYMGLTPYTVSEVPAGEAHFVLKRRQFRDTPVTVKGIEAGKEKASGVVEMKFSDPPVPNKEWENSLEMVFDPLPDGTHISRRAVSAAKFDKIQGLLKGGVEKEETAQNEVLYMIQVPPADSLRFCDQLTALETQDGWLTDDLCYRPEVYHPKNPKLEKPGWEFFRLVVEKYGQVTIESTPSGAAVFEAGNGGNLGTTPYTSPRHRPGVLNFSLKLPGFLETKVLVDPENPNVAKAEGIPRVLKSGESLTLATTLQKSRLAVFGKRWANGLQQVFQPIDAGGTSLLVAARETQVKDYAIFAKEKGREPRRNSMNQADNHPVVNVTRNEAREFCQWLTKKERAGGYLNDTMEYRLLSDAEWSFAALSPNLVEDQVTPAERHLTIRGYYPWAPPYVYPPPVANAETNTKAAANLGDLTALRRGSLNLKPEESEALEEINYDDGYAYTAPTGSYTPNAEGLFDLSGNVWEFVGDDYGVNNEIGLETPPEFKNYAVVRGGAWNTPATDQEKLATHYRKPVAPDKYSADCGFRIVLAPAPAESRDP